jgi:hypothetical protein
MDRTQFSYLLLHANALPMLAMQQVMSEIEDTLAAQPAQPAEVPTEAQRAEREAQAATDLEDLADRIEADLELAAIDRFDFAVPALSEEEALRLKQRALEEDAAAEAAMADLDPMPDGSLDLGAFLARAYARPLPAARVDAAFARADRAALAAAIALLPADLPPLTAALDSAGLARWLALFRTEDAQCEALLFAVSRTDEGA